MADKSQRTEQPTPRRVDKARREGQFASSRELIGAVQFVAFVAALDHWGGTWVERTRHTVRALMARAFEGRPEAAGLPGLWRDVIWSSMWPLAVAGAALVVLSLGAQLAMTRMGFSLKRLAPDFKRLNPASRLGETFRQNRWALVRALVLLPLASLAIYCVARDNFAGYLRMPLSGPAQGIRLLADSLMGLLWKASAVFLALGLVDMMRQKRRYTADLRMSRHEIREEAKELEGNPHVKLRIRRLQRELVRRQMLKQVKTATAVIVNPTHYAVALRYSMEAMSAPVVVAKGRDYLARRIREIAVEHQVPLVENPPLARALYESVKVGQEIPVHLYRAVAEILAYIYRLMHGRRPA